MSAAAYTLRVQFGTFLGVPNWLDITPWVDGSRALTVTRGRQGEEGQPAPTRLTVPLINDDGRFTPDRPGSPYWPNVTDGAKVELTAVVATGVNLEDNASAELGIGEWSGTGASPPALTQSTGHVWPDGGAWALLITWAVTGGDSGAQRLVRGLTIGQTYTVSRRVWVPAGSPDVRVRVNGGFTASGTPTAVKDTWAVVSVTFVADNTSVFVDVYSAASPTGGQCWVDGGQTQAGAVATAPTASATLSYRFVGEAIEWPTGWTGGPADVAETEMMALGLTDRLGDRAGELRSFAVQEALLDKPLVLLPLTEAQGATQAGNLGSDGRAAALANVGGGGTAEFGGDGGPPAAGGEALELTRASAGSGFFVRAAAPVESTAITLEAFVRTTQTECLLLNAAVSFTGDPYYGWGTSLKITSLGKLEWRSDGGLIVTSPQTITDGQPHHVAAVYVHTGSAHTVTIYVDGAAAASGSTASTWQYVKVNWLLVGGSPKLALYSGGISHAALYPAALTADRIAAHAAAGLTGFGGERTDQRISRLAAYADLQSLTPAARSGVWVLDSASASVLGSTTVLADSQLDLDTGGSRVWGQSEGGYTPLTGMQDTADTEGGAVLESRTGYLDFHSRASRYNQPPRVQLDLADGDVQPSITPGYDPSDVVNDATITTQDGAVVRVVDDASVAQRGRYATSRQSLTRDAADALSEAGWRVRRHARPGVRYRQVEVDLTAAPAALVAAVLAVDVGSRLDLLGLPPQAPSPIAELFAEGYTETVSVDELTVSFNASPAEGYRVWVLDNPELSVLDQTTMLAW